jgi:hypothetical protein
MQAEASHLLLECLLTSRPTTPLLTIPLHTGFLFPIPTESIPTMVAGVTFLGRRTKSWFISPHRLHTHSSIYPYSHTPFQFLSICMYNSKLICDLSGIWCRFLFSMLSLRWPCFSLQIHSCIPNTSISSRELTSRELDCVTCVTDRVLLRVRPRQCYALCMFPLQPWIQECVIGLAEQYGVDYFNAPPHAKQRTVQIIEVTSAL